MQDVHVNVYHFTDKITLESKEKKETNAFE